jgi:hypothetical protein
MAVKKKAAKKPAPKKKAPAKKAAAKRKPNAAFMKPMTPSAALGAVIGSSAMPRTEVTKKIWAYIKKNGLQDKKNRRNINADEHLNRGNRLHPHYLVYLDDQGQVIADHTEVKHLLDVIRAGCRNRDEPAWDVCHIFNAATRDGAEMGKYSRLLTDAIRSMIDVDEERDIDSLFSPGRTTALVQTIAGLDDFELIAFLAFVEAPTDD